MMTVFMFSLFLVNINAKAEITEKDLFNNDKVQDITISITYENDDVTVTFVAPNGTVYDPLKPNSKMSVFKSKKAMLIAIDDAQAGLWKIRYDKGSNPELGVKVDYVDSPMWIKDIKIYTISGTRLPVEFVAQMESSDRWYDYTISISTDNNFGDSRPMVNGSAKVNEKVHVDLDLNEINSHDTYYVMIKASYIDNGTENFDIAYSDKFSYTNPQEAEKLSDCLVTIDENGKVINVNWNDTVPNNADEIFAKVTKDGKEPEEFTIAKGDKEAAFEYTDETKSVKIELSLIYDNGRMSEPLVKEIKIEKGKDDFAIDLGESGLTNSSTLSFTYKNADKQEIFTRLNEAEEVSLILDGNGRKSISLTEDNNVFYITYTDKEGVIHKLSKIINIDKIAPSLEIFENIDGAVVTKENLIITGKTTGADKITVNDLEVELLKEGSFSCKLTLEEGKNDITIKSTDVAGNTTLYQAQVTYSKDSSVVEKTDEGSVDVWATVKSWLPLIIALACSIVGIIVLVIIGSNKKKLEKLIAEGNGPKTSERVFKGFRTASILTFLLAVASVVYYIIRRRFMQSEGFIELAYKSVSEADTYMKVTQYLKYIMTGVLVMWAVLTVVAVLMKVIMNFNKKPKKEKQAKVKKEKHVKEKTAKKVSKVKKEDSTDEKDNERSEKTDANKTIVNKFCPECGAKLPEGSSFCQSCGHRVK